MATDPEDGSSQETSCHTEEEMSWRVHLEKPLTVRAVTIWGHVRHSKLAFSPLSGHFSSRLSSLMAHKTTWNKRANFRTEIANPTGEILLLGLIIKWNPITGDRDKGWAGLSSKSKGHLSHLCTKGKQWWWAQLQQKQGPQGVSY